MDHGSIVQVAAHFAMTLDGVVGASHTVHPNHLGLANWLVADGAVVVLLVPVQQADP